MKMLIIGIVVSLVFVYFTFKGVSIENIFKGFENVSYKYLVLAVLLNVLSTLIRTIRLQIILSPIKNISLRTLFPITCIGFMAIVVFPLRTGELVRPYLVHHESQISLTSSLATIFLERVFDSLILLGMLVIVILSLETSPWITQSGYGLLVTFLILVGIITLIYFKTDMTLRLFAPLTNKLNQKWQLKIEKLIRNIVDGFKIMSSLKNLFYALLLSLSIWVLAVVIIYILFCFLHLNLTPLCALTVLIITIIGISIPAAPGFLGTFQFACIMGLSFFNVPRESAVLFSIVYYVLSIGITILLAFIFLPFIDFSFKDVFNKLIYNKLRGRSKIS